MRHSAVEEALVFGCRDEQLVGILHAPAAASETAVIIIVGGPQYRVGSHRQFVHLGRSLAASGYPVLRFDYRGMGDSTGATRDFEHVSDDIATAIDTLQQRLPQVERVVLWGLCDGASAALMYCDERPDPRVHGLCLLNPWVRSAASMVATQLKHYYTRRLLTPAFWAKLFRGRVARDAFIELARKILTAIRSKGSAGVPATGSGPASFQERMAKGWRHASSRILLILSGNDYTAKEFVQYTAADKTWRALLAQPGLRRHTVAGADHTFSDEVSRLMAERLTLDWLEVECSTVRA